MALSPMARELKRAQDNRFWIKKAQEYGISMEGRTEQDVIKEARKIYMDNYWEQKAQSKAGGVNG